MANPIQDLRRPHSDASDRVSFAPDIPVLTRVRIRTAQERLRAPSQGRREKRSGRQSSRAALQRYAQRLWSLFPQH
jgi:hypothetical protein